jgi:hypothetical protein
LKNYYQSLNNLGVNIMAKFGFDVTEVTPDTGAQGSFEPIPAGEYFLKAVEAEEKATSKGDGSYIKVKFEVIKGQFEGRLIWQNFNINNPSEKAQRIGRQQIVAWAAACGKPDADDTDKLIEKPFKADIAIEKGNNGYADGNRINAFLFESTAKPAPKAAAPAPAAKAGNPWD